MGVSVCLAVSTTNGNRLLLGPGETFMRHAETGHEKGDVSRETSPFAI
jgi:hypothetical protein